MSNNTKFVVGGGGAILALLLIALYYYQKSRKHQEENERLLSENNRLAIDKYRLMIESIQQNGDLSSEVKSQLEDLIKRFENINEKVSNELIQALELLALGRTENAIEDISKIIENLLQSHYDSRDDFKAWLKGDGNKYRKNLQGYLKYCCSVEKKITQIDHDFIIAVKSVRNADAHELDFNLSKSMSVASIIAATESVIKIAEIVHPEAFC